MHNISTIYRFNTPFLDLEKEKKGLLGVIKKIEKSVEFDGIVFNKKAENLGNYYRITLTFNVSLGKIDFYYISEIGNNVYHLPIFKLDIFLNNNFISTDDGKKNAISFLNNIFECFDGLNEKEYLIDIDNHLYYKEGFFGNKKRASYDFSNLNKIKKDFESKNGMQLLKDFILRFQSKDFVLTRKNADEYHKLHGVLLYFIYLVFLISKTIKQTDDVKNTLNTVEHRGIYEGQIDLMKERLNYVDELNRDTFERYKRRLELFFKMF